jgi:mRNA-degrading endonuclease RelE of RelBE toxin-antitoxin system
VSYQIEFIAESLAEAKKLPAYVRPQVLRSIQDLAQNPRPARARELRDKPGIYRIWVATEWRIVYEIDDDEQIIVIRRIRRKDQIDYDNI